MLMTVFVSGAGAAGEDAADPPEAAQRAAEITEDAWERASQPGEILRLFPAAPDTLPPLHAHCELETVLPWKKHPYMEDVYAGYELPAALLQWLARDTRDATVLLLDENCLQRAAVERELNPEHAIAHAWDAIPEGNGPFGLADEYATLAQFCVNRELELPGVRLPLLIHSRALRSIAARWLELTGIIRHDVHDGPQPSGDAMTVALNIALAEHRVSVDADGLGECIVLADESPAEFDAYLTELRGRRENGSWLKGLCPIQRPGVRQGRVLDQVYLESGWPLRISRLNGSAAAIWLRCDGQRSLWSIALALHDEYHVALDTMLSDVAQAALQLRAQGAISLETI